MKNKKMLINLVIILIFVVLVVVIFKFRENILLMAGPNVNKTFFEICKIVAVPLTTIFVAYAITKKMTDENNQRSIDISNKNRIDGASEWRKNIMDIASKNDIDIDDVLRIRSSLRFKSKEGEEVRNEFKKKHPDQTDILDKIDAIYDNLNSIIFVTWGLRHIEELISLISKVNKLSENREASIRKEIINMEFHVMTTLIISYCDYLVSCYTVSNELTFIDKQNIRIYSRYLLKHHWEFYINILEKDIKHANAMSKVAQETLELIQESNNNKIIS